MDTDTTQWDAEFDELVNIHPSLLPEKNILLHNYIFKIQSANTFYSKNEWIVRQHSKMVRNLSFLGDANSVTTAIKKCSSINMIFSYALTRTDILKIDVNLIQRTIKRVYYNYILLSLSNFICQDVVKVIGYKLIRFFDDEIFKTIFTPTRQNVNSNMYKADKLFQRVCK